MDACVMCKKSFAVCLDNLVCDRHFNVDGKLVCHHGLCELGFSDSTGVNVVCPLELQRLNEKSQWERFYEDLPLITCEIMKIVSKNDSLNTL